MRRLYKKSYKGIRWDKLFGGILSILIVLETNLISHTFKISDWILGCVGILTVCSLLISMLAKVSKMKKEITLGKRKIISQGAERALKIVEAGGILPIMPLFLVVFEGKDNLKLFWMLISILLLFVLKFFFDDIVTFTGKGYSSGFDEIEIEPEWRIEMKRLKTVLCMNEMVCIEFYKGDVLVGWEKFSQEDGEYMYNHLMRQYVMSRERLEGNK